MPNIVPTNSLNIDAELQNLSLYKYHPNGILNASLNRLTDMLDGKVTISDPSNPFTYLLETSSLNTAFAIQEFTLLTRKLYPRLANNEKDLYLHMSDFDYLGIFSEPAYGQVIFNILYNDFQTKASYDPIQKEHVLKLPRHLKVTVDKYVFTLPSAIIIRLTETGVLDIKFENQTFNNIFPVETNSINFNIYKVNQNETYITFVLKMPEIDIEPIEIPVEKSKLFKNILTFNPNRKFYYFRAFYMSNGIWNEMLVTHTDEVYDILKPTCIIKVLQNEHSIEYYIPPIYMDSQTAMTKVKFLVYTTNGYINVNFNDFPITNFSTEYNPVFPDMELSVQTESLQLISKVIYLKDTVSGGKDSLTFNQIKTAVIDNSIGDRLLPITNKQQEFYIQQNNFRLIKNVDNVTNRVFLLETNIPNSTTRYPITKINLDIIEYMTTISNLKTNGNSVVDIDQYTTIIPENTIFKLDNNGLRILTKQEYTALTSLSDAQLVTEVNNNTYVSTIYNYVLDTSNNVTELRPYDVSNPVIHQVNFKEFNPTARIGINTTNMSLSKVSTGYSINVLTNLKKYINTINETNITPYLVYVDTNGTKFYLEGRLYTSINNNPVYRFDINTNYYIDKFNRINISNFKDINNNTTSVLIDIDTKLELIYVSNIVLQNYATSALDNYIFGSYLSTNSCVVTLEEITIKFCDYLKYLYSRVHTSTGTYTYQTHSVDVPMRYTSNVYNASNVIVNHINDIVYDNLGNVVYQYRAGDVMLDSNGNPIPLSALELTRYINLLFMDYRAHLVTKKNTADYVKYVKSYLTKNITIDAVTVQGQLLENTEAFVVVPKNIDMVTIKTPYRTINVGSLQSFSVDVGVDPTIYNDITIRDNIKYTIINELDTYLSTNTVYSKTVILDIIYNKIKEYVKNVSIPKFTNLNEEYMEVINTNERVSLNKILIATNDGYDLLEDVTVTFTKIA